jgi:hypothetical protein
MNIWMNELKERGTLYVSAINDTHLYEVLNIFFILFHDQSSIQPQSILADDTCLLFFLSDLFCKVLKE